ncbi:flagellar biosynthesis anti-sigma factor FlgM [Vibrio zhugei]|uniref:Negative regulator of flagellin synthesis n=1 Tax=Vibrio zhugei TaxID=2479546 RepID=A0ABV7C2Z1_9VIBR|nr:flagellar biosynthesis anti-sigma factor FlgM [Vibrio zhugei]
MAGIDNIRSGQSLTTTNRSSVRSENNVSSHQAGETKQTSHHRHDAVSLSSQSKAMEEMKSSMASSPSFDSAKVAAIKDAIANGSYVVDPDKLADSMIRFENELNGQI